MPQAQHVTGVLTHLLAPRQISADGKTVYEIVTLDLSPDDSPEALQPVEDAITPVDGVKVMLAGGPAFYGDIQVLSENDLRRSEFISLPLAALALLLVFGSVVAAGVPIVVGGTAVVVALGALFFVAQQTALSIFVLNLATLLGLGLGVDYALLLDKPIPRRAQVAWRRPDRRQAPSTRGQSTRQWRRRWRPPGRAVFFSGLTVLLGLIGLILFEFMVLRSVGIAGAMVVGLAVASASDPAARGPRDARTARRRVPGQVPRTRVTPARPPAEPPDCSGRGCLGPACSRVMDHPLLVFIPTLPALLILGAPFLHVHFDSPDASILPPGVPQAGGLQTSRDRLWRGRIRPARRRGQDEGPCHGPGKRRAALRLLATACRGPARDPSRELRGRRSALTLEQYQLLYAAPAVPPTVSWPNSLAATTKDDLAAFTVFTPYGPNRAEGQQLVADMRTPGSSVAPPPGVSVLVGGGAAEVATSSNESRPTFRARPRSS